MALVKAGRLRDLRNGFLRERVADELCEMREEHGRLIVGFDFAFSFPAWFVERQGASSAPHFWPIARRRQAEWIDGDELQPPFHKGSWGEDTCAAFAGLPPKRRTDPPGAASCFLLQGQKQVGRGSLRGFPVLASLREAGFRIWPFDAAAPSASLVIELYPRSLYQTSVSKGRWRSRLDYLQRHHDNQDPVMRERAAGSGDSFDAAVSALEMDRFRDQLDRLTAGEGPVQVEGEIWRPEA